MRPARDLDFQGRLRLLSRLSSLLVLVPVVTDYLERGHFSRSLSAPDAIHVEVEDTGPGIPRAQVARVFEKFYQVTSAGPVARRGTGLGLYFCRLAVEAHGGRISIRSGPEGGTTVSVVVPKMNLAHESVQP